MPALLQRKRRTLPSSPRRRRLVHAIRRIRESAEESSTSAEDYSASTEDSSASAEDSSASTEASASSSENNQISAGESTDSLWSVQEIGHCRCASIATGKSRDTGCTFLTGEAGWARGPNGKWRRVSIEDDGEWELDINGEMTWTYCASWERDKMVYRARVTPVDLRHDTRRTKRELDMSSRIIMRDASAPQPKPSSGRASRDLEDEWSFEEDGASALFTADGELDKRILRVLARHGF